MAHGDGSIFQRGNRWFAQWFGPDASGRPKRFRQTAGNTAKEARAFRREKLREVGNHRVGAARYLPPSAARRFALTVGHALEAALLVAEASRLPDGHPLRHAAARFARFPLDSIRDDAPLEEARALLGAAEPVPAGREP